MFKKEESIAQQMYNHKKEMLALSEQRRVEIREKERMFNIQDLYWMTDYNDKGQPFLRMAYKDGDDYYFCTSGEKAEKDREIPYSFVVSMEKNGKTVYVVNEFDWCFDNVNIDRVNNYEAYARDPSPKGRYDVFKEIGDIRKDFDSEDFNEFKPKMYGQNVRYPGEMRQIYERYARCRDNFNFLTANDDYGYYNPSYEHLKWDERSGKHTLSDGHWEIQPKSNEDIPHCYVPESCVELLEEWTARKFDREYRKLEKNERDAEIEEKDFLKKTCKKLSARTQDALVAIHKKGLINDGACVKKVRQGNEIQTKTTIECGKQKMPTIVTMERYIGKEVAIKGDERCKSIVSVAVENNGKGLINANLPKYYTQQSAGKGLEIGSIYANDARMEKR